MPKSLEKTVKTLKGSDFVGSKNVRGTSRELVRNKMLSAYGAVKYVNDFPNFSQIPKKPNIVRHYKLKH